MVKSVKCCLLCVHYNENEQCIIKDKKVMIYNTCNDFKPDTDFIERMEKEIGQKVEFE